MELYRLIHSKLRDISEFITRNKIVFIIGSLSICVAYILPSSQRSEKKGSKTPNLSYIEKLLENAENSTVYIQCAATSPEQKAVKFYGTGIIIDKKEGLILTCRHCIVHKFSDRWYKDIYKKYGRKAPSVLMAGMAHSIRVTRGGASIPAHVLHLSPDPDIDLALIKCSSPDFDNEIKVNDFTEATPLKKGTDIWMIGCPKGEIGSRDKMLYNQVVGNNINSTGEVKEGWSGSVIMDPEGRPIGMMHNSTGAGTARSHTSSVIKKYFKKAKKQFTSPPGRYRVLLEKAYIGKRDNEEAGAYELFEGDVDAYVTVSTQKSILAETVPIPDNRNPRFSNRFIVNWYPGQTIYITLYDDDSPGFDILGRVGYARFPQNDFFPLNRRIKIGKDSYLYFSSYRER